MAKPRGKIARSAAGRITRAALQLVHETPEVTLRRDLQLSTISERLGVLCRHFTGKPPPGVDLTPFPVDDYLAELYELALANAEEFRNAVKPERGSPESPAQ